MTDLPARPLNDGMTLPAMGLGTLLHKDAGSAATTEHGIRAEG